MFGKLEFEEFYGLTSMPQKAASAWGAVEGLIGASYKPLLYVGTQAVKGINHWFIAEQVTVTATPERSIVVLAINEFNDAFSVIPHSIEKVKFEI